MTPAKIEAYKEWLYWFKLHYDADQCVKALKQLGRIAKESAESINSLNLLLEENEKKFCP